MISISIVIGVNAMPIIVIVIAPMTTKNINIIDARRLTKN
jgi:uncharacterized DUF497 family protein